MKVWRALLCFIGAHEWRNANILHGTEKHDILVQCCARCALGRIYTQPAGTW